MVVGKTEYVLRAVVIHFPTKCFAGDIFVKKSLNNITFNEISL